VLYGHILAVPVSQTRPWLSAVRKQRSLPQVQPPRGGGIYGAKTLLLATKTIASLVIASLVDVGMLTSKAR